MSRKLVAFFSASGVTAKLAEQLSEAIGADPFEIEPAQRYIHIPSAYVSGDVYGGCTI